MNKEHKRTNKFSTRVGLENQDKGRLQNKRHSSFNTEKEIKQEDVHNQSDNASLVDTTGLFGKILNLAIGEQVLQESREELQKSEITIDSYEELFRYWLQLSGLNQKSISSWEKYIKSISSEEVQQFFIVSDAIELENIQQADRVKNNFSLFLREHLLEMINNSFLKETGKEDLLEELNLAFSQKDEKTISFLMGFIAMFSQLNLCISMFSEQEDINMELCFEGSKEMFQKIKGKPSPYRRTILDTLASSLSDLFETYRILSPERSLTVDPSIHDLKLVANKQYFTEGLSFAVIRKNNNTTAKHALIQ